MNLEAIISLFLIFFIVWFLDLERIEKLSKWLLNSLSQVLYDVEIRAETWVAERIN